MPEDNSNPWPIQEQPEVNKYPAYLKKYIEQYKNYKNASKVLKNSKEIYTEKPEYKTPDYMQKYLNRYLGDQSGRAGRKPKSDAYNEAYQKKHGTKKTIVYSITLNPREKLWKLIRYFAKKYNKPTSTFCMEIIVKDLMVRMHHEKRNRENTA